MAKAYFTDRQCWMQHMRLDPKTGLDPSGIKLRAVTGLEAVDWFVPGYFVWGRVIESLGEVGYDANMLHAAPYDWQGAGLIFTPRSRISARPFCFSKAALSPPTNSPTA